jgi:hypothetical protein
MMFKAMLGEAWLAMGANRLRTALTMLGMVIGVGAVVIMMAIGQGAQYAVQQTISTMGSNLFIVLSGSFTAAGVRSGSAGGPTLNVADGEAMAELDGVVNVAPTHQGRRSWCYGAQNWNANVVGTTPEYLDGALVDDRQRRRLRRFRRALGDARGAARQDHRAEPVRRRGPGRQDHAHPAEPLRGDRRARQQGPEPRRQRPGRHRDHSADHRPAQGVRHALPRLGAHDHGPGRIG